MSTVSESLSQLEVLVVDCQATAAAPHGHLLEMGWARAGTTTTRADARLIALPHGEHKLRRAQIVAHTTVDKDLAVLKAFFNWCVARSLAASNPVCRVKFFNEDNSRLRYLTEDEYNRLIEAAKTIKTSPFLAEKIILSVHTGLRRGSLGNAARKLDQYAAQKVIHLRGGYSTPIDCH